MSAVKESFAQMFASGGKWVCFVLSLTILENEKAVKGGAPLNSKAGLLWVYLKAPTLRQFSCFLSFMPRSERLSIPEAALIFRKAEQLSRFSQCEMFTLWVTGKLSIWHEQERGRQLSLIFPLWQNEVSIAECLRHDLANKHGHLLSFVTLCRASSIPLSITPPHHHHHYKPSH